MRHRPECRYSKIMSLQRDVVTLAGMVTMSEKEFQRVRVAGG
jgi:hypothetical protein